MARMRRGLVHAAAWSLATGAAVTLSWWGVHTVMAGTAYDPPRAVPITAERPVAAGSGTGDSRASSTQRPAPVPSASPPPSPSPTPSRSPSKPPSPSASSARPAPASPAPRPDGGSDTGSVRSYAVDGGRVVFDIGESSAELVTATPASGWQMQVWTQPTYVRVTFSSGGRETDVFCTWHDQAPRVQIERR
ncbi:hypothetical protein [Streptomyces sp. ODS05-4]|uniref:hypothetical protein n=1 Tax=Streptomyces sp. ODS05-4 TaxID=2944939 RepID=UPI00210D5AE2|nr:hypothetical protein [Streptomyces sp. ODS05-4]